MSWKTNLEVTGIKSQGEYVLIQDRKATNTAGQQLLAASGWQTLEFTHKPIDEHSLITLGSNQLAMKKGEYIYELSLAYDNSAGTYSPPFFRLRDITNSADLIPSIKVPNKVFGNSFHQNPSITSYKAWANEGRFIIPADNTVVEFQGAVKENKRLGEAANITSVEEHYKDLHLIRVAIP